MNVLIIDDKEVSVKGIIDFCKDKDWTVNLADFTNAYQKIGEHQPDIIILDWRQDADSADIGDDILSNIWDNGFRPIVIFSANAETIYIEDKLSQSVMLKKISKGDETPVTNYLCEIEKFATALTSYRNEISKSMIESINSLPVLNSQEYPGNDVVKYILSKRTATYFDEQYCGNLSPAWVQYICPPIAKSLCVCDIIRAVSEKYNPETAGVAEEYLVILTPSCDLVPSRPKVTHALCAWCCSKNKFHSMELAENPKEKNIENVAKHLNAGYNDSFVALPGLSSVFPYMAIDLKKLENISTSEIAYNESSRTEAHKFVRIASTDSPFREQLVWAHMLNSCRPGVPDRNVILWAEEMLKI